MSSPDRLRSTRERPAKAPLSEAAIIEAALAIAHSEGLAAVTMRRVAASLDTGAASLYVYLRNREELLGAMFDRAVGMVPVVAPEPEHWREQIHDLLNGFLAALTTYPGLATALEGESPATENVFAFVENLLSVLLAGGISAQDAAWSCDTLNLIVTATASEADVRLAAGLTTDADRIAMVERMRSVFEGVSTKRYPNVAAHAFELVTGNASERFHFSVDTFLDGLVARNTRR
jgi:AcrR family transcriptional regulator